MLEHLRLNPKQDLPVLIFSALRPAAGLLPAPATGRRDFILKPFDLDELRLRLQRLLHLHAPRPA